MPEPIVVDPVKIAAGGILRVVLERLHDRVEERLHRLQESDRFVREAGRNALAPRGFGIKTPPPQEPINYTERLETSFIGRRVRKLIKIDRTLHEITQDWGKRPKIHETSITNPTVANVVEMRSINAAKKRVRNNIPRVPDFSKPVGVRESKSTTALRNRAQRRYRRLQERKKDVTSKIDAVASGDTFLGKRRERKIAKLRKKQEKYRKRLGLS